MQPSKKKLGQIRKDLVQLYYENYSIQNPLVRATFSPCTLLWWLRYPDIKGEDFNKVLKRCIECARKKALWNNRVIKKRLFPLNFGKISIYQLRIREAIWYRKQIIKNLKERLWQDVVPKLRDHPSKEK